MSDRGLSTYEDWLHCLTNLCQITPTAAYVRQRLAELEDENAAPTHRFIAYWGEPHRQRVIAWFKRLEKELVET